MSSASSWNRLRSAGLGAKLILFSTLLTLVAVAASFVALSLEIRTQTKRLLTETVSRQQSMIRKVQQRRLEQMLRTSALLTDSPTLRAALEIYRTESAVGATPRADIRETIEREAEKVASILGRDLLVITDDRGRVLATTGGDASGPVAGEDLSTRSVVRRALEQDSPVDARNLAVLDFAGEYFQVGTVPIALQGFIIGALAIGDRMDREFIDDLRASFDSEIVLSVGGRILASSLTPSPGAEELDAFLRVAAAESGAPVLRLGDQEYVTAPLVLGAERDGRPVTLFLLHSLTGALAKSNRSLLLSALIIGVAAVTLAGLAAGLAARSLLRPLGKFVGFMRSVADQGDYSRRFASPAASHEVRTLIETYHLLSASLEEHEQKLLLCARDDLERLERLKESEKLAALGRLLSGAAHEINNPLTGVVGNIEMLMADGRLSADARDRLASVRADGQRIVALVRNLLRIAHRTSGDRSIIDLNEVVRDTAKLRNHDFATAGMQLRLELSAVPLAVFGSALELQQVALNIINNAFDALEGSGDQPQLIIRTARSDERVVLTFSDNGPGITSPQQVFDHFYTTKPVGHGTGLGLSISHAIVERHAGEIVAENLPGGGACFTIELPAAAAEGIPATDAAPAVDLPVAERSIAATVLVVDDEPNVLELQMAILDSVGASPVGVHSGAEAIERLEAREFDLIVSDLRMPGAVSGKDLFRWVEAHRPAAVGSFLFVTGDTIAEAEFLQTTPVRCLLKPFTMEEYLSSLRETLHAQKNAA